LKTLVCMTFDRLCPIGWPITPNFFGCIFEIDLKGLKNFLFYEAD
jgi:hypothetical protein